MSAHRIYTDLLDGLSGGHGYTLDPGSGGVITPEASGTTCIMSGTGKRTMAAASAYPIGTTIRLLVDDVTGGSVTVDQGDGTIAFASGTATDKDLMTFAEVGDFVDLVRAYQNNTAKVPAWQVTSDVASTGVALS